MVLTNSEQSPRKKGGRASKVKGSKWEIECCRLLSMWVTDGKRDDLFWRAAMSGGRATRREVKHGPQLVSGDIAAVHPEGAELLDHYFVECKHLKSLDLTALFLRGKGSLLQAWQRCVKQAASHKKLPMLIGKQNLHQPVIVLPLGHGLFMGPALVHPGYNVAIYLLSSVLTRRYVAPRAWPGSEPVVRLRMNKRVVREKMNVRTLPPG